MTSKSHGSLKSILVAVLIISLAVSGCLAPSLDNDPTQIVGFKAIYEETTGDGRLSIEIHPPEKIRDRDNELRSAYKLTVTPTHVSDSLEVRNYHLDASLQVVREDRPCSMKWDGDECTHSTISYTKQGALPPFGLFWLNHLQVNNTFEFSNWMTDVHIQPEISENGENTIIKIAAGVDPLPKSSQLSMEGTYTYGSNHPLPLEFKQHQTGGPAQEWRLADLDLYDPYPSADHWPKSTMDPLHKPRTATMFPGEDDALLKSWTVPSKALVWLVSNNNEAANLLNQGCVQLYALQPSSGSSNSGAPLLDILSREQAMHRIRILDDDGDGKEFVIRQTTSILGDIYELIDEVPWSLGNTACHKADQPPAPSLTAQQFVEIYSKVQFSAHPDGISMRHAFGPLSDYSEKLLNPPSNGWDRYILLYIPDHVDVNQMAYSWSPYFLTVSANTQWYTTLVFHPEDLIRFDSD